MTKLTFDAKEVTHLIEHARKARGHMILYDMPITEPSLVLVKDDGIYLMSSGLPPLPTGNNVAYAKGYNPNKDYDVWHRCRDAVGGDDFAEPITLTDSLIAGISSADAFGVRITHRFLVFSYSKLLSNNGHSNWTSFPPEKRRIGQHGNSP